jgi:hypothetical protein
VLRLQVVKVRGENEWMKRTLVEFTAATNTQFFSVTRLESMHAEVAAGNKTVADTPD